MKRGLGVVLVATCGVLSVSGCMETACVETADCPAGFVCEDEVCRDRRGSGSSGQVAPSASASSGGGATSSSSTTTASSATGVSSSSGAATSSSSVATSLTAGPSSSSSSGGATSASAPRDAGPTDASGIDAGGRDAGQPDACVPCGATCLPTTSCNTGLTGACAPGHHVCANGNVKCVSDLTGTAETCADLDVDNDCDGETDEPPDELDASCPAGPALCGPYVRVCSDGGTACIGTTPPGVETCANVGSDDDCDGRADELGDGITSGQACNVDAGACGAGFYACADAGLLCVPAPQPTPETCANQGIDNDCDGIDDELTDGVNAGQLCDGGAGICQEGALRCVDGGVVGCVPMFGPAEETCQNQDVDNDCDGDSDEVRPSLYANSPCDGGHPNCPEMTYQCEPGDLDPSCRPAPDAGGVESCSNPDVDNDCDGVAELEEGFPEDGPCAFGEGCTGFWICGVAGLECSFDGTGLETCSNLETNDDCDGVLYEVYNTATGEDVALDGPCVTNKACTGTWACNGTTLECVDPSAETACDGADDDCDGQTDEETCGARTCVFRNEVNFCACTVDAHCGNGGTCDQDGLCLCRFAGVPCGEGEACNNDNSCTAVQ